MNHRQAIERLEQDHLRRGLSPATLATRVRVALRFLDGFGRPVKRAGAADVRAYLAERRAGGLGPSSVALELGALRAFFRAVLDRDPTEGIQVNNPGPKAPVVLTGEAVQTLLRAASSGPGRPAIKLRDRVCLELLYGAGIRASEAAAIRVSDLSLADQSLQVRPAKQGPPRTLPLPAAAHAHVARYMREGRPHLARSGASEGRLLLTRSGRPLTGRTVTSVVDRVAKRAGIRAHSHALRRAVATHLVAEGVSVEGVRQLLGHADLETTALYVAVDNRDLRRVIETLDLDCSAGATAG